jgi:hypothetical protein
MFANKKQQNNGKGGPNCIEKKRARISNLKTTNPRFTQIRVFRSRIRTLESGVRLIKSLGTTLMNVVPNYCCWSS